MADVTVPVTGVYATATLGSVLVWGVIPVAQTPSWTPVPDTQTPGWTPVVT